MKLIKTVMNIVGGVNWLVAVAQLLIAILSQFMLIFYAALALLHFLCGAALIGGVKSFRKIYLYAIVPVSVLASWNVASVGREVINEKYFSPEDLQLALTAIFVLVPLAVNVFVLNQRRVKELFKS